MIRPSGCRIYAFIRPNGPLATAQVDGLDAAGFPIVSQAGNGYLYGSPVRPVFFDPGNGAYRRPPHALARLAPAPCAMPSGCFGP